MATKNGKPVPDQIPATMNMAVYIGKKPIHRRAMELIVAHLQKLAPGNILMKPDSQKFETLFIRGVENHGREIDKLIALCDTECLSCVAIFNAMTYPGYKNRMIAIQGADIAWVQIDCNDRLIANVSIDEDGDAIGLDRGDYIDISKFGNMVQENLGIDLKRFMLMEKHS